MPQDIVLGVYRTVICGKKLRFPGHEQEVRLLTLFFKMYEIAFSYRERGKLENCYACIQANNLGIFKWIFSVFIGCETW